MRLSKLCRQNIDKDSESRTPLLQRFSCGVGHVMNDITRQLLYSFRLVFFMNILGLSAANAGWLSLFGFILTAVSSTIAAFLIDRIKLPFLSRKLGRRKSWHLIGTVMGVIIIPLYFSACIPCRKNGGEWQPMIYVSTLNTILSLSYSLMEIGHLSVIPIIAKDQSEAVELNTWRTVFSFLSGVVTFLVAWAILGQDSSEQLSTKSSTEFSVVIVILVGLGLVFAVTFHVGTKEPSGESEEDRSTSTVDASTVLRKSSFVPSYSLLQSMTYMGTDLHCQKERMRDRFIDSVKSKRGIGTEEDQGGPLRKTSFAKRFINALFTIDEEEQEPETNEVSSENEPIRTNAPYPSQTIDQDDEKMLKAVTQLPNERKISLFMSIVDGIIGEKDNSASEQQQPTNNNTETSNVMNSQNMTTCTPAPKGVHNEGLDFDEGELIASCPDPIPGTEKYHVISEGVMVDSLNTNGLSTAEIVMNGEKSSVAFSDAEPSRLDITPAATKTAKAWLKDIRLYKVAFIFTCTMVVQNASYGYLPLFLIYTLQLRKEAIAYLPLIMLISAAISSGVSKKIVGKVGGKWCFIAAASVAIGSGVWFYFITQSNRIMIYPAVVLLGVGFSSMTVNALSFAADLIGENKSSSGAVFAFMSFMLYLTDGTVTLTIQNLFPQESNASEDCDECGEYVRHVIAFVPGSCAVLSLLVVLFFQSSQTTRRQNVPRITAETDVGKTKEITDTHC